MFRRQVPSAWEEMERLQREMNRLVRTTRGGRVHTAPNFPAINIWTSEEGQMIIAEIPGIDPETLDITVTGEILTLSGERVREEFGEDVRYHRRERGHGRFKRSIQLPFPVEVDEIEANFKNGVLSVTLPRAEEDKPRKIDVKSV
jgi:HSP20 family protein